MDSLDTTARIVAIVGSALLFFFVLELLRRRRLGEPYAILWLVASAMLLALSIWDDLLNEAAELVGIRSPANMLFAVAFAFVLVLLLTFSTVVSRLSRENKILAQEVARLNREREQPSLTHASRTRGTPERQESPIPE